MYTCTCISAKKVYIILIIPKYTVDSYVEFMLVY